MTVVIVHCGFFAVFIWFLGVLFTVRSACVSVFACFRCTVFLGRVWLGVGIFDL